MPPPSSNPHYLSCWQHINTCALLMVVDTEDHTLVRPAVGWQSGQRIAHASALDQTAHHTHITMLGGGRCLIATPIRSPAALQSKPAHTTTLHCPAPGNDLVGAAHTLRPVDVDAGDRDPRVIPPTSDPPNLPVCHHIDSCMLCMIVHVEDQPPLRTAVTRQCCHHMPPPRAPEQPTNHAQCARLHNCGCTPGSAICLPAIGHPQRRAPAGREHDPSQTDPQMIPATSMPSDGTIRVHIDSA